MQEDLMHLEKKKITEKVDTITFNESVSNDNNNENGNND